MGQPPLRHEAGEPFVEPEQAGRGLALVVEGPEGGIAQALPALGQALMQKFGGGGGEDTSGSQK